MRQPRKLLPRGATPRASTRCRQSNHLHRLRFVGIPAGPAAMLLLPAAAAVRMHETVWGTTSTVLRRCLVAFQAEVERLSEELAAAQHAAHHLRKPSLS